MMPSPTAHGLMPMNDALDSVVRELEEKIGNPDLFVRAVLSGRRRNMQPHYARIDLRPVAIQGERRLQWVEFDGRATFTRNETFGQTPLAPVLLSGYANLLVETVDESVTVRIGKKGLPLLTRAAGARAQDLAHDRAKPRLLDPADPFLVEVGISDARGQVKPSRQDKYRQVEEFLRLLAPSLESALEAGHISRPVPERPLTVVDLGCGHAYLTFAAHQYLRAQGTPVTVTGVDVRTVSRERNAGIAARLGIAQTLSFEAARINDAQLPRADVVLALHACDTATDDALAWAVRHDAALILAAPCCHHDLQRQMEKSPEPWPLVTRHGLLKERLGDVLTDALRCQLLRLAGYRVETVEFVSGEHTPRNLMIRAVRTRAPATAEEIERYRDMVRTWAVRPTLATRLQGVLGWDPSPNVDRLHG